MANLFRNPLVVAETVVGSMIDLRNVVLYAQPEEITKLPYNITVEDIETGNTRVINFHERSIEELVKRSELVELFTGIPVPYLSDINGYNMFGISYMGAEVNIGSDLCDHPLENGEVITDNAIINPIEAKVSIVMPTAFYTRIYKEIEDYFINKKYIMLQTKLGLYRNLVISQMPYKMERETIDRPQIDLTLRQIMVVEPRYVEAEVQFSTGNTRIAENQSTVEAGYLSPKTVENLGEFDVTGAN